MGYKSLLTVMARPEDQQAPLSAAVDLARHANAHLDVVCLGVDHTQLDLVGFGGAGPMVITSLLEQARDAAVAMAKATQLRLAAEDIRWSVDQAVAPLGAIGAVMAPRARYADLLVTSPPLASKSGADGEAMFEAALFDAHIPVLIVPAGTSLSLEGLHVVIAWNDGNEALAAVRAAMPILTKARDVSVVVIDPPANGAERSDPGGALAGMLSRHGVHANILVIASAGQLVSDILLREVQEIGANMIVMGAYGHSRLRETLLGGATREMLAKATVPVFMGR